MTTKRICLRKRYQTLGMLTEPMSMFRFTTSLFLSNSGTRDHLSRIDNEILRSTFLAEMVWKLNEIKFEALNFDYPNLIKIFHFLQKSIMLFTQKSQHIFCRKIILNSINAKLSDISHLLPWQRYPFPQLQCTCSSWLFIKYYMISCASAGINTTH